MNDAGEQNVGPCCGCGADGMIEGEPIARNIVMYDFKAPVGFTGWACVVCNLPPHGAIAVLCDACAENGVEPRSICGGKYVNEGVRVSLDGYERQPFHHDISKHPELDYQAPEVLEGEEWQEL